MITPDEGRVIRFLALAGITAAKIAETSHRTPDLLAYDEVTKYLIEVKVRTDDETLAKELHESGYAYRETPVAWTNTVATILADAVKQLRAVPDTGELKLVWVCVRSRRGAEETLADQVRHTLYGISRVAGAGRGAKAPPCLFFHDSTFHKHSDLAGVVLDLGNRSALCLNPFSDRTDELRRSKLGVFMGRGMFDPAEAERKGSCLIADCDIDRRDSERVLAYVSEKYDIDHAVHFNLDEHSSWGVVRQDVVEALEAEEEELHGS